ncbi:tyrosine-type recombinase/integrase [Falsiroseomonas sp.]|uniref:tyrosine-type recombinase/integrase n=1 Tax=Falsiroseomonas sp. TaxID=2870721 RepID=UPI003565C91A
MTRIKLDFVQAMKDRHGRMRYYFSRKGWARVTLPGAPGSREFMEAYQAALAGKPEPVGATRAAPGTMAALSGAWRVTRMEKDHGDKRFAHLQPKHLVRLRDDMAATPTVANRVLQLLHQMMQFAVERGLVPANPARDVRKLPHKTDGHHSRTDDEIAKFKDRHPLGSRARLALALLLYTGQRRSDVIRMGRQHVREGRIAVVQEKTGTRLEIPMRSGLTEAIEAMPAVHLTYLTTEQGKPFTAAGFGNWFRERCQEAGLPVGCTAHGLRKAAARRLAETGCTPHEIAAITGHQTLREVERYTRAADQARLADEATRKVARIGDRKRNPE